MVTCVSPDPANESETRNTLDYASRAATVRNAPRPNFWEDKFDSTRLAFLEHRVSELEEQLGVCAI